MKNKIIAVITLIISVFVPSVLYAEPYDFLVTYKMSDREGNIYIHSKVKQFSKKDIEDVRNIIIKENPDSKGNVIIINIYPLRKEKGK